MFSSHDAVSKMPSPFSSHWFVMLMFSLVLIHFLPRVTHCAVECKGNMLIPTEPTFAIVGKDVTFECCAVAQEINFYVNGIVVDLEYPLVNHFWLGETISRADEADRLLHATATKAMNNSRITCVIKTLEGTIVALNAESPLILFIRDAPVISSVSNLSSRFLNSETIEVSWDPPKSSNRVVERHFYKLDITDAFGNQHEMLGFSDNFFLLRHSDFPCSVCYQITFNVSVWYGEDSTGPPATLPGIYFNSIPSKGSISMRPVFKPPYLQLKIFVNTSDICVGKYPVNVSFTIANHKSVDRIFPYQRAPTTGIEFDLDFKMKTNIVYEIISTFTNNAGSFGFSDSVHASYYTYDLEAVKVVSSFDDQLCAECIFRPFTSNHAASCIIDVICVAPETTHHFRKQFSRLDDENNLLGCVDLTGNTGTPQWVEITDGSHLDRQFKVNATVGPIITKSTSSGYISPTVSPTNHATTSDEAEILIPIFTFVLSMFIIIMCIVVWLVVKMKRKHKMKHATQSSYGSTDNSQRTLAVET